MYPLIDKIMAIFKLRGLWVKTHTGWHISIYHSSTVFLGDQFETLYKCYRNTVMCMCLVNKGGKLFLTKSLLFRT